MVVPFVASYRKGAERLVFVGVRHAFVPNRSHDAGGYIWIRSHSARNAYRGRLPDSNGRESTITRSGGTSSRRRRCG